jgi:uracil-DNA glycosylase family 4
LIEKNYSSEPEPDCSLCPRLAAFRHELQQTQPSWFNAPVPSFVAADCRLLIIGLAPGLKGANRTGRPFTGDFAGDLLYATLSQFGFSSGNYAASAADGLQLQGCSITNAVRCVPPQNKPTPEEIRTCRSFLKSTIAQIDHLEAIIALGRIAHESVLKALDQKLANFPFRHGAEHRFEGKEFILFDSYHCSRYNTNTGVLSDIMFKEIFRRARAHLDEAQTAFTC